MINKVTRVIHDFYSYLFKVSFKDFLFLLKSFIVNVITTIKTRQLASFHRALWSRNFSFKIKDKNIILSGRLFGYANEIYIRNVYFALPDFFINKDDVVVDLGSDGGVFSILAAIFGKKVIAVEPSVDSIEALRQNAKLNNCLDEITIYNNIIGGVVDKLSGQAGYLFAKKK